MDHRAVAWKIRSDWEVANRAAVLAQFAAMDKYDLVLVILAIEDEIGRDDETFASIMCGLESQAAKTAVKKTPKH